MKSVGIEEKSGVAFSADTSMGNKKLSYLIPKRVLDILISGVGLLVLLVPLMVVAALIRLETPGPALYKQERLGKGGKPFIVYKFRSMYVDAEKDGPQWTDVDDPRRTKMGKIIRPWRIDELPQLINILKGDMSIVGPRPERAYFYDVFEKEIPDFRVRLSVDQGLTGFAQLNGGYELEQAQRLAYDKEYMAKQSLWTDFVCILKTIAILFSHEGAR